MAATGVNERISVSSSGAEASGDTSPRGMSADGRFVAFVSTDANLVPGDDGYLCGLANCADVFVRDRLLGTTEIVSVDVSGDPGNRESWSAAISDDGRYVVFASAATDLVPGVPIGVPVDHVYLRDRTLGTTELVDIDSSENLATSDSGAADISANGRFVAFDSMAPNLVPGDTNNGWDVFVRDRILGTTTRVSTDSGGNQAFGDSQHPLDDGRPSISADGRFVAFRSRANNLVPGDANDKDDVFVKDRQMGALISVSQNPNGNGDSWAPAISRDGRYVAFVSQSPNLVPGDNGMCPSHTPPQCSDIFLHDLVAETTQLVSVSSTGDQANNDSLEAPSVSDDGRYVLFSSLANNLVPGDTNAAWDAFVRDTQIGTTSRVSLAWSGGQASGFAGDISADGQTVSFTSGSCNIVLADANAEPGSIPSVGAFIRDLDAPAPVGPNDCGTVSALSIDMEDDASPANTATLLGSLEKCRRINNNGLLDFDEDSVDAVTLDVVAGPTGIPASRPIDSFSYTLQYDPAKVRVAAGDNDLLLGAGSFSSVQDLSESLPDVDGAWAASATDNGTFAESGPGVLSRVDLEAVGAGYSRLSLSNVSVLQQNGQPTPVALVQGATIVVLPVAEPSPCLDADGDGTVDAIDNCVSLANIDQANHDADSLGDTCDLDDDNDGVPDNTELPCGGDPLAALVVPERVDGSFAGMDDDADGATDEVLPTALLGTFDCDQDGFTGSTEDHVFGPSAQRDQDPCGVNGWPADFIAGMFSTNKVDIQDMSSFIAPVRYLGTNVGANPGDVRWDLVPGKGGLSTDINVQDMAKVALLAPPMLGGARAFSGPSCPWPP